jgi:hypothetical protein
MFNQNCSAAIWGVCRAFNRCIELAARACCILLWLYEAVPLQKSGRTVALRRRLAKTLIDVCAISTSKMQPHDV